MPIDYTALRTEIQTDPQGLGYAAASVSDQNVATILNTVRAGVTIRRNDITAIEISNAIDVADYPALSGSPSAAALSTERHYLAWISGVLTVGSVRLQNDDGTDAPALSNFKAMFGAGTTTRTRLIALATRFGSRAEQLFGTGTVLTTLDIAKALR